MAAQRFIGIRSGLTGETIIMFPTYSRGELRIRTPEGFNGGNSVRISPVLGRIHKLSVWENSGFAIQEDGVLVDCGIHISALDAAMSILQCLSDQLDPRLELEHYVGSVGRMAPLAA